MMKQQLMTAKKIGANLSIIVDGERLAKRVTKDEGEKMLKTITSFNDAITKKRSEKTINKWKKIILDFMSKSVKDKKIKEENKKATIKAIKRKITKKKQKETKQETKQENKLLSQIKTSISTKSPSNTDVKEATSYLQSLIKKAKDILVPKAKKGIKRGGEY